MEVKITPKFLKGTVDAPPSKSVAHRKLICSALAKEPSVIHNFELSNDMKATISALTALGAVFRLEGRTVHVAPIRPGSLENTVIDCLESGSTLRFIIPIALALGGSFEFIGSKRLMERPLDEYFKIFDAFGIKYNFKPGISLRASGKLSSGCYELRGDISSQFITGLLFALPLLEGESKIRLTTKLESKGYLDITLKALAQAEIIIQNKNYLSYDIKGNQTYKPKEDFIEGDFSQAAFFMVAGAIGSEIDVNELCMDSEQGDSQIIEILNKAGCHIKASNKFLHCSSAELKAFEVNAGQIPDLVPILAVLACFCKGRSRIFNAGRLRIKESDRLAAITRELNKAGAKIIEKEDELLIEGIESLNGGTTDSWNDHRIAMALAIASTRCKNDLIIKGSESVNKSYPSFWNVFKSLGGDYIER